MSTNASSSVTFAIDSEQLEETVQEYCKNLLPNLPRVAFSNSFYMYKYRGFWFDEVQLAALIAFQNQFQAQDTDIVLITHPKSGTTWLKSLMFTLANRNIHPVNQSHPLTKKSPHSLVPSADFLTSPAKILNPEFSCPLGRLYATHCPLPLLPETVLSSGCKIVYICRSIKDVFVSYWHFIRQVRNVEISFEEFFDLFCKGVSHSGPVWDHVLDYWKASLEKPQNMLFLKYEELMQDPASHLKLLADFMGCPISLEEETNGSVDEILGLCSFDHLKNQDANKSGAWRIAPNHSYFRKGKVGDWENYLTSDMAERLDQITAQKFHESGLNV